MFNGKLKAVTFSFDDGVTQDVRLIELFDKYGLKCTFNINSELLGKDGHLTIDGKWVSHVKVKPDEVKDIYKNHEVAVHTLTHPNLTECDEAEIIRQVEEDRKNLSRLSGQEVIFARNVFDRGKKIFVFSKNYESVESVVDGSGKCFIETNCIYLLFCKIIGRKSHNVNKFSI